MMNRNRVVNIVSAFRQMIKDHQDKYPALDGLVITDSGGKYGSNDVRINIIACEPISSDFGMSNEHVRKGHGVVGQTIECTIDNGVIQQGTIVKVNPTRYKVLGVGGKWDNKVFTIPHYHCRPEKKVANATNG